MNEESSWSAVLAKLSHIEKQQDDFKGDMEKLGAKLDAYLSQQHLLGLEVNTLRQKVESHGKFMWWMAITLSGVVVVVLGAASVNVLGVQ